MDRQAQSPDSSGETASSRIAGSRIAGLDPETPVLSLVVPFYNEAEVMAAFFDRLLPVLEGLTGSLGRPYEIICVNDGSSDDTLARLVALRERLPAIRVIDLSRNFGKDVALTAGLDHVRGAAVVPIDSDLQDPPELIPELFAQWLQGYDVVYGQRRSRGGDGLLKRLTAGLFYRFYNRIADVGIPQDTGDYRLMDRRVVEAIRRLPERNRFMKGIFSWVGYSQIGVPYARESRPAGRSKWRYWQLWNFALDGITASSTLPLRVWSYLGGFVALLAFLYGGWLIGHTLVSGVDVPGYASLMVAVLFFGGVNLIGLGVLGEYIARIHNETMGRPLYLVRERIGFEPPETGGKLIGESAQWSVPSTTGWRPSKTATGGS